MILFPRYLLFRLDHFQTGVIAPPQLNLLIINKVKKLVNKK